MDRGDAGFSTLETLVALALAAAIGLAAVQALSGGRRAATASRLRSSDAVRLLQLDAALRRAAGEVRVPYWTGPAGQTPPLPVRAEANWIELGGEGSRRFGPFERASVEPIYEDGDLWGAKVAVQVRGQVVELRARIGSRPLGRGDRL